MSRDEKYMRDEKAAIVENAIKKFGSEVKERKREVTEWKNVTLAKVFVQGKHFYRIIGREKEINRREK